MVMIREGTMEVTINGKSTRLGPGGVAYLGSNDEHGWKNVGSTTAHYFVIAIGQETILIPKSAWGINTAGR